MNHKGIEITHPNEEQTKKLLGLEGYNFLGWENGWKNGPQEYQNCRALKHKLEDRGHNNRGSNNTRWCTECKLFWKYDCSD